MGFSSPESKAATRRVRVQSGSSSTIGHRAPKSNHRTTLGFGSPSRLTRPTRATSPSRLGSPPRSARPRRGSRGFEQEETDLLTLAESDIRGWDVYEIIRDSVNNHAEGRKLQASGKAVEEETMPKVEEITLKCDLSDGKSLGWPHITQVGRAPKLATSFEELGRRMLNLLRRSEHCTLDSNRVMDIWYGRQHLPLHERDQLAVVFATFKRIVVLDQQ
jgi:hypothetical protein